MKTRSTSVDVKVASSNPPGGSATLSPRFKYAFIIGRAADPGQFAALEKILKKGDANRVGAKQNRTPLIAGLWYNRAHPIQNAP